jgi:hypothetical protein
MITDEWLAIYEPCKKALDWWDGERDAEKVLCKLISEEKYDWANWLIVRLMTREQCLRYAIYSVERCLPVYEAQYPGDNRVRMAVEAARIVLLSDTIENRDAAAHAAFAAAYAAYAAAHDKTYTKILEYGLTLIEKE